jgi:hypothetical protein
MRYVPTAGMEVVESDDELRISGQALSAEAGGAGATVKAFFNEPIDCSVWFRVQELGCDESGVSVAIHSESGAVHVRYHPTIGYVLFSSGRPDRPRTAPAFGDETSEWHQLRLTYDPSEGSAQGFVDGALLGTVRTSIEGFAVSAGVVVERYGCFLDVRFDDFELKRLGEEPEQLPPPAEIVDEEARWDRDPWLGPDDPLVPGQVVERRTPYGDYFEYVPPKVREPLRVAAIVHGSYGDAKMDLELSRASARTTIHERGWLLLADTKGVILVAPSFDGKRFYGYRWLEGIPIGSDKFLLTIIDGYKRQFPSYDGRFYLFGNSAGGEFTACFIVTHPERVLAAGVSSSGGYPYPYDWIEWPFGRSGSPNPDGFVEASTLPVRVVRGSADTHGLDWDYGVSPDGEGIAERARTWAEAMRTLAVERGLESGFEYVEISGAGHSAWALDISTVWWLADIIDAERAEQQSGEPTPLSPETPTTY